MEPKKLSLAVGRNLKKAIKASVYITQDEFAFSFGVNERTVGRWVNEGIRDLDVIESIADFLQIDVFELLSY